MMAVMIEDIRGVDDIKVDAGKLNLRTRDRNR